MAQVCMRQPPGPRAEERLGLCLFVPVPISSPFKAQFCMRRSSTVRTLCGQDYVKDLSRLGRSMSRTVLVDNDPFSGLLQPCNVLPTRAFHGEASDRCRHLRLASPAYLARMLKSCACMASHLL